MNLNQITLPVLDIEKSIEFYQKLGLKLIVHSAAHYARFQCPKGGSTFSLHQSDVKNQDNGIWIYFEIENLDQRVNDLSKQGFIFEELPNDKPWLWREARLKDLDGNQLILYFAGENRINPPWKIK